MIHMETVRLTASQALVRFLENQYISYIDMDGNEQEHKFVKGIFMLPGHGNVVGFANGVEQELKDMVVYQGKNEQGMALAAVGYAKQMRRNLRLHLFRRPRRLQHGYRCCNRNR